MPYPFTLPPLPYPYDALQPYISKETMEYHHDKHHQAYVDNLNAALKDHPDFHKLEIEDLLRQINKVPEAIRQAVINNGGGHYNHTMFWEIMKPGGSKEPKGALADAIKALGGLEQVKQMVNDAGLRRFGSGWAWLVVDGGHLKVISTPNQDCPLMNNQYPVLGVDVWEHAYYIDYRNRRGDYLKAWWNVVNWDEVSKRFDLATKK
ncbi:MAG: superoxide dismutase [Gemmatales bacterium]|nr:superoxide dismutase [Gemmatales bacterium]MCS7159591.1 superoxide dismutase [Gemmatales bacterium]MDW8174789.1 superoxide dismutase [Gemmatales bacterium]MDW8222973.1 superoxide dismutase [Gemmatales bacterium]